jgi:hypothetical protein
MPGCEHERNGASGSGETASGGTIMETGIAQADPPPPATGWPRSGADGSKLAASALLARTPDECREAGALSDRPAANPAGNCPSR